MRRKYFIDMNDNQDIGLRITELVEHFADGVNTRFAEMIGTSEANIRNYRSGKMTPKYDFIFNICSKLEINYEWLILGRGNMFKENINYTIKEATPLKCDLVISDQDIPIYEISAAAGLSTIFNSGHENIIDTLRLPKLGKCDGAVFLQGDSMYPLMKSGDVVVFKMINNIDYLLFGNIYLVEYEIDGDEYLVCKYVQKGDKSDCVKLVSYNHHHQERDIPMSSIRHLALVKAYVTYNNMH